MNKEENFTVHKMETIKEPKFQERQNALPGLIVGDPLNDYVTDQNQKNIDQPPMGVDKIAAVNDVLEEIKDLKSELSKILNMLKSQDFYSQKRAKNLEMQITYISEVNNSLERRAKSIIKNIESSKSVAGGEKRKNN